MPESVKAMKKDKTTGQTNVRAARKIWNTLSPEAIARLREIAAQHGFSVSAGDLIYLNNRLVCHAHWPDRAGTSQEMQWHSH